MKLTILLSALTLTLLAHAQNNDYPYLTFQTADGNVKSIAIESLRLTFSNGLLVATNGEGSQTYTLTDLSKMFFSQTPTAIAHPNMDRVDSAEAEVFTMTGVSMGTFADEQVARASLPAGLYVIRSKDRTYKMSVK